MTSASDGSKKEITCFSWLSPFMPENNGNVFSEYKFKISWVLPLFKSWQTGACPTCCPTCHISCLHVKSHVMSRLLMIWSVSKCPVFVPLSPSLHVWCHPLSPFSFFTGGWRKKVGLCLQHWANSDLLLRYIVSWKFLSMCCFSVSHMSQLRFPIWINWCMC